MYDDDFFTDEELVKFYKKIENADLSITATEAVKLLNVLRAYDMDSSCVLQKYWV